MQRTRIALSLGMVALVFTSPLTPGVGDAQACGVFVSARDERGARRQPSLAAEKVLIVHDAVAGTEHFIREVAFRDAPEPFGFVVPTPGRPEVAAFGGGLFETLRAGFPFAKFELGLAATGVIGSGSGYGRGSGGVEVLETTRVGSFTAFVLAADDPDALAQWLVANNLAQTPESGAWLRRYVAARFFFVALRYEPPRAGAGAETTVRAETIRVSFPTPVPYYPYLEPARPPGATAGEPRSMELWLVTRDPVTPVALRDRDGRRTWVRPLREGERYVATGARLREEVHPDILPLLPAGELVLQTFQDQKRSRDGYGDLLFVPVTKTAMDDARRAAVRPLLAVLDPELAPRSEDAPP